MTAAAGRYRFSAVLRSEWIKLRGTPAGVGYLLKDRVADIAEFAEALDRVAAGGTALDPEVVSQLLAASHQAAGIVAMLVISDGAVEKHIANIFAKLGLAPSETDNRRVLAVLRHLQSQQPLPG